VAELVVLNLGKGDWQQGCPMVMAQLWRSHFAPMQFVGSLPALPELGNLYSQWQQLYMTLYAYKGWRQIPPGTVNRHAHMTIEVDEDDVTHISATEFHELCQRLGHCLNTWLTTSPFLLLERQLRTQLDPTAEIRCIITADNQHLLRLPWHQWQFFEDYPKAELALSRPEYMRPVKTAVASSSNRVKILAILGDSQGIQVNCDRELLEQLPYTELRLLVEPQLNTLNQQLWEPGWDILFFAGHSSSGERGQLQINPTDRLTLEQLRYGLKQAIACGLKLAIFNSCDGLQLAWDLADLHIPQVIVMREPIPDRVAQEFLKYFLAAFSSGQSLYLSVREARERLQGLESDFPCASWLPVICQNPAELPQTWQEWRGEIARIEPPKSSISLWQRRSLTAPLLTSVLTTALVLAVRSLGLLQPLELWGLDHLMRLRPAESPDSRFLIVTINEADIQAQDPEQRRGSISDEALNQLLTTLEQHQAQVIGLDIYRDFPVHANETELVQKLHQNDRLITICKSSNHHFDPTGTAPPPEVPPERVGFSDFLEDQDGILRRHLVFMTPDPDSPCTAPYAFNTLIALRYLKELGIEPQFTSESNLQLGNTVFHRLQNRAGGYQTLDARGSQLLLNYRALPSPLAIAPQVALTPLLQGRVNPAAVTGRIVLIGVTAPGAGDYWLTPYGSGSAQRVPGVFLQAHMSSQLLSAVLEQRPVLGVWPVWQEGLWIWAWAGVGGLIIGLGRSPIHRTLGAIAVLGVLPGLSLLLLIQGIWVPLLPAAIGCLISGSTILMVRLPLKAG
jgi:CHASE2 domain-containing sensor protein